MTTANAESGQIRPANKLGRGRLQHTAFVVAMGAQPIGLLEVDARLRWRGVCWLHAFQGDVVPRGTGRIVAAAISLYQLQAWCSATRTPNYVQNQPLDGSANLSRARSDAVWAYIGNCRQPR